MNRAADRIDTSQVDAALANARLAGVREHRRQTIASTGVAIFWGGAGVLLAGIGLGALCYGASFLIQPKIVETTKIVEVPKVIETTKVVEVPKAEAPKDGPAVAESPEAGAPKAQRPVTRRWDELSDKHYQGIITDVEPDRVCFDHDLNDCVFPALVGPGGKAVLDASGAPRADERRSFMPMQKWIGYSAYTAASLTDPDHLVRNWVANRGTLIQFESVER